MSITTVETFPLVYPLDDGAGYGSARGISTSRSATLVRLETDSGLVGWGEASGPPRVLTTIIDEVVSDWVIDQTPASVGSLSERAYSSMYHFSSGGLLQAAISAIDIALWDLKGKSAGQPIYELLGGAKRSTLRPYASTMYFAEADREPETMLHHAVEEGFDAVKIKIGRGVETAIERVSMARDELGDALLMVDANGNYRADQAIRFAQAIEPYDIRWFEEPVAPENVDGYREVRASTSIPIAGGEAALTRFQFERLFENRALDLAQPDVCMCGGLTEAMHIADLATVENIGVSPHCWMSGVGLAASLHFASAVPAYPHADHEPEPPLFEVDRAENPLRTEILADSLDLTGSSIEIPDGPGLGVTVDTDIVEQYRVDD